MIIEIDNDINSSFAIYLLSLGLSGAVGKLIYSKAATSDHDYVAFKGLQLDHDHDRKKL